MTGEKALVKKTKRREGWLKIKAELKAGNLKRT